MPNPTHMIKLTLQRTVAYIDRLPLFTRLVIVLAVACEILAVLPWWDVRAAGRLEPDLIGLSTSMSSLSSFHWMRTVVWYRSTRNGG